MPYPIALTSQEKTDVRTAAYQGTAFVLKTPQSIVFQATVKDALSDVDYASIDFDSPTTGAYTDIAIGMTVLVHRDSSDIDNTLFQATYARSAPTPTIISIGWQATDLLGTDTISVLDDYRLHAKQTRISGGRILNDYNDAFAKLAPVIYGLQSVYAVNQSTTATLSFAPSVDAMASGAAISTYLWDVGDGTITVGTSASQNITATFPAWSSGATDGWRWVSLTATDDNSNSTIFHFQVFVGDLNSADWVIQDFDALDIGSSQNEGLIGSISLGATSAASLYDDIHITVVIDENKNGDADAIVSNIAFVGRVKSYVDEETAQIIEEYYGVKIDESVSRQLHGYGVELARLPIPYYPIVNGTTQDWHYITSASVSRSIWYGISNLTTAATLMSFNLDTSTYNGYNNDRFQLENGTALDTLNKLASLVGNRLVFARSGEVAMTKDARLLSDSDRNALATIVDLTNDDLYQSISLNVPEKSRIGKLLATGFSYNTTTSTLSPILIQVQAPKIPNTIGESERTVDVLLASDVSVSTAITELSVFAANFLALRNEVKTISTQLLDGYWFLLADNNVWYTLTYDFPSGLSYDTGTRWFLDSISLSIQPMADEITGSVIQQWTNTVNFVIETADEGTANSYQLAPAVMPFTIDFTPTQVPYGLGGNTDNSYDTSDVGFGTGSQGDAPPGAFPTPIAPPYEETVQSPGIDSIDVPLAKSTSTLTNKTTVVSNVYQVLLTGYGEIGTTTGAAVDNFVVNGTNSNYTIGSTALDTGITYNINVTGTVGLGGGNDSDALWLSNDSFVADFTRVDRLQMNNGSQTYSPDTYKVSHDYDGTITGTNGNPLEARIQDSVWTDNSGSLTVTITEQNETEYSDGFYTFTLNNGVAENVTAIGAGAGIYFDGTKVTAPPFSNLTGYYFTVTGTGAQEAWIFTDSTYNDNTSSLRIKIAGTFA